MGEPLTGDGTGLAGYLAAAVRDHPDRIAVRERNRGVSYRELDAMTAALAARLHDAGAKPGDRVVVWLNKSIEAVAAIHGILRAGCAYVPIDPTSPPKRAAQLITRTTPVCVLTTPDREQVVRPELEPSAARGFLPIQTALSQDAEFQGPESQRSDITGEWPSPGPDDLAYILHTSGSTGTPKGVMLSHRNARAFVDWVRTEFRLRPDDVLASHAPLHFDLSILDVFAAAAAGACVTLVPESFQGMGPWLVRFVLEQQVSVWYSVPGALRRMADADREGRLAASRLRVVAFAGEVYHTAHLRTLRSLVPTAAALYNLYGPTETNVCTYHEVTAADLADDAEPTPPIGLPCPYAGILIQDGELWVGGASVMTGYWGDPAGTAERIVTTGDGADRYYRTGDLVHQDPAGRLRYLGRSDGMVKLNGYRVELGEVEAILSRHPHVAEAACVVDDGTIAAFVVPRAGAGVDPAALSRHCADYLPRHMVPRNILPLAALPQTSTGKTDRRALTARAAEPSDGG